MAGWSPDIQVLKSDLSGLLQLVSYVKFKVKAGSGGVVLRPMKYFPPESDVSGLLQLVSYVKFKVKAGSGGVVLGPMKYFPPIFCSADYSTHFEGPRFA